MTAVSLPSRTPRRRPVTLTPRPADQWQKRKAQWCLALSLMYLAVVYGVWLAITLVSESWWLGTVLVYLPRSPWVFPAIFLMACSVRYSRLSIAVNAVSLWVVIVAVMNLRAHSLIWSPDVDATRPAVRIVTRNIQGFRPNFPAVIDELSRIDPDVIAFQEVFNDHPLMDEFFADWHTQRVDEYFLASRWPLRHLETCFVSGFDRVTAVRFEVKAPFGTFEVVNVHQTSPRRSLTGLRPWSLFVGDEIDRVERYAVLRSVEADKTRECVSRAELKRPVIVVGDFNMPTDSSLFRQNWGDLSDAFALTGSGFGYTSPCSESKLWPANTPWSQVDHILATPDWQLQRCWIGTNAGSDHRMLAAVLRAPFEDVLEADDQPDYAAIARELSANGESNSASDSLTEVELTPEEKAEAAADEAEKALSEAVDRVISGEVP